ncbi:hypothetical protein RHGRI_019734 [Rhododendron griersonianum]|uniref:Uncharacterized protein n=1 Tax=Rhododendron griersonianum TaxID=479676 RepID=A0AAV6JDK0_9ERIC|nr:hypothetical protein RHGRI_019734 [Rhododendron griersonianum]
MKKLGIYLGNEDSNTAAIVKDGLLIRLGNGAVGSFWSDVWLAESTLTEAFPRLYMILNQKTVRFGMLFDDYTQSQNLSFRRNLMLGRRSWWRTRRGFLMAWCYTVIKVIPISWRWVCSKGSFSVKPFYEKWGESFSNMNHIGPHVQAFQDNLKPS